MKNLTIFQAFACTLLALAGSAWAQQPASAPDDRLFLQSGSGAVARSYAEKARDTISVFDYMTPAQIAAVKSYAFAVDVTAPVQKAMDAAWAARGDLFVPGGGYLVTGLTLPGNYPVADQRSYSFRMHGQGYGSPFAILNTGGTIFKSVTNGPILSDRPIKAPNSHGTYEIEHLRFDGTSSTPVVLIHSLYGTSSIHNTVMYQRGKGDGLKILYGATGQIYENYVINKDFAVFGIGTARTGVGINFPNAYGAGLVTFRKNTSRGFLTGYVIGGGAGTVYSAKIADCEASTVYNGIILEVNTNKVSVEGNYFEGGDGGVAIQNRGNYNSIRGNLSFKGFSTHMQDNGTSNTGSLIEDNIFSIGSVKDGIGIDVQSSAASGGNGKTVSNNSIVYTEGTAGVIGLKISGTDPRVTATGNAFSPRGRWTGVGTRKISDQSSSGIYGFTTKESGNAEMPVLSRGAVSFLAPAAALTQADVVANALTIPENNYIPISASAPAKVNKFNAGVTSGRLVLIRTTTANMAFTSSPFIKTAGGAPWTGPGIITFMIDRVGADNYAYEVSRTSY